MKQSRWVKAVLALLLTLAGGAFGYFFGKILGGDMANHPANFHKAYNLLLLPMLVICFLFVVAIHELGHVFAGLSVGFQFRLYIVGPLMWEKEAGSIRFKWNRNLNTFGGLALCLPQSTENLANKFIRFAAGGPLASLLLTFVCLGIGMMLPHGTTLALFLLNAFFHISALMSLLIFIVTAIPMQAGGFASDGARVRTLSRGGTQAELEVILLHASTQLFTGIRPRLLDAEQLHHGLELPVDSPFKAYLHSLLYYHYLDAQNPEKAEYHLREYTDHVHAIPQGYQATVWLEQAWFAAVYQQDSATAQAYFNRADIGAIIPRSQILRVEAAIAHAAGDKEKAVAKVREALAELPKAMDKGTAIAEREWLEGLVN